MGTFWKFLSILSLVLISEFGFAQSSGDSDKKAFLERWHANPKKVSQEVPKKSGQVHSHFTQEQLDSRDYVDAKAQLRKRLAPLPQWAPIDESNLPRRLFETGLTYEENLLSLDSIRKGSVKSAPWSGYYWATYLGQTAYRYMDYNIPMSSDWLINFNYYEANPPSLTMSEEQLNNLSPAEKYDLLVGDANFSLTKNAWQQGKRAYDAYGKVESWFGLCHGWAPAAFSELRPLKDVQAILPDGRRLTFYPSDLKALITQLWSNSYFDQMFLGGRCNEKNPPADENGRITLAECFDVNPATWHILVLNHVGRLQRSFVFDATFDYQVWNQPIASFKYSYFNPKTRDVANSLNEAKVAMTDWSDDPYKAYRSAQGVEVVGVTMDVVYVQENPPGGIDYGGAARDNKISVSYFYDLEINAEGKVIGGEWYQNAHPDFVWKPVQGSSPVSFVDPYFQGEWAVDTAVPQEWKGLIMRASQYGQPVRKIVEKLLENSI